MIVLEWYGKVVLKSGIAVCLINLAASMFDCLADITNTLISHGAWSDQLEMKNYDAKVDPFSSEP